MIKIENNETNPFTEQELEAIYKTLHTSPQRYNNVKLIGKVEKKLRNEINGLQLGERQRRHVCLCGQEHIFLTRDLQPRRINSEELYSIGERTHELYCFQCGAKIHIDTIDIELIYLRDRGRNLKESMR